MGKEQESDMHWKDTSDCNVENGLEEYMPKTISIIWAKDVKIAST